MHGETVKFIIDAVATGMTVCSLPFCGTQPSVIRTTPNWILILAVSMPLCLEYIVSEWTV
jgi:hypothetical protein